MPLSRPPPTSTSTDGAPRPKTLVELIDEKRPRHPDGTPILPSNDDDDVVLFGAGMTAAMWTGPLAMLLFTFDVLVHQQYVQEVEMAEIVWRVVKAVPAMFILLYVFHPRRHWASVQLFFFVVSVAAGCWVVHAVNRYGYYKVMKRAPAVGTLWIWAAVEMTLGPVVLSSLVVAGYTWWMGYGFL
ncbi:hypothetical protein P167DRAFT_481965 [Morchella conica CCBAS932]|uniref:DUF7719 domain-containing protein n=2 Tax=Morchella sect. Distantes TaxID=1051054 RepID=A0A3N4KZI0_9PEZI|nr:hypothetical protein P167DRAFT_481965 [Morchella conica CCBAS932]